tara:strand:+ start:139 stop:366 length:228 start_codon:yes stop_codon:yes gene_type:complete
MNLYEKLKPEIKKAIKLNAKKYPHSGRILIAKLHLHTMFHELTMGDIRDLISLSNVDEYKFDVFDWKYGDLFFKD